MIGSLWHYRDYVRASVARELRLRYAGSALGALWQVLSPLALIAIYTIVFSGLMKARLPGVGDSYAYTIYVCSGLLAWTMFADILTRSQTMFLESASLLKKSSFPRSCVPAVVGSSALASFAIVYSVFLVVLVVSGRWPGVVVVGHVLAVAVQVWFWLTPIVYPVEILPAAYSKWVWINPVTPIVHALQSIFVQHAWPDWSSLLYPAVLSVALGMLSAAMFRR